MRRIRNFFLGLLLVPTGTGAQTDLLGLYDDAAMTTNTGIATGPTKDIYLGIRFGNQSVPALTGIEFSIEGLDPFFAIVTAMDDSAVAIGTPEAPSAVNDTLSRPYGMNIAWPSCLSGDRVLAKITLTPRTTWPPGKTLRIRRRYPPSNAAVPYPLFVQCNDPIYTATRVAGGMYGLGPAGVPACGIAADNLDFGNLVDGRTEIRTFNLTNTGSGFLTGAISVDGADFALVDPDPRFGLAHMEMRMFALRFSPSGPGERVCRVTTDTSCDTLVFTGRNAPTPIAAIRADENAYVGREIMVQGVVFLPAKRWYSYEQYPSAWIQDASGRGLQLDGRSVLDPICAVPGNEVRLIGGLTRIGGTLAMAGISSARLVSTGNPLPTATAITPSQATESAWEGTYVELTGVDSPPIPNGDLIDRGFATYPAELEIPYIGGIAIVRGAIGAVGQRRRLYLMRAEEYQLRGGMSCHGPTDTPTLTLPALTSARVGERLEFPVKMQWNVAPVDSFAFWLAFDGSALQFADIQATDLSDGWPPFEVHARGPDTLVVRGASSIPIPANASGDLARLSFEVVGCAHRRSDIRAVAFEADFTGMAACDSRFTCHNCPSNGDINQDGALTPGDARCALGIYLAGQSVPGDCSSGSNCEVEVADVDCSFEVTPYDAMAIFQNWVRLRPHPVDCFALNAANDGAYRLDGEHGTPAGDDRVAFPIEIGTREGACAFAAEVRFDPGLLEFVGLEKDALGSTWPGLGAQSHAPGRILVGGFDADGMEPTQLWRDPEWTPLARLVFRKRDLDARTPTLQVHWKERILGAAPSEDEIGTSVQRITLRAAFPNPLRGNDFSAWIDVPRSGASAAHLAILDVRGRVVRLLHAGDFTPGRHALHWDGRDATGHRTAAGIYVLRLRAGAVTEHRKLVVLH